MSSYPKISIITVTYNSQKYLSDTIESVINQNYDNFEYIIIDGLSTDKTVDIIKEFHHHIYHWISEPDSSMYEALNKGLQVATGDFILCLNSDDYLRDPEVLKDCALFLQTNQCDALYGNIIKKRGNIYKKLSLRSYSFKEVLFSRHCSFVPHPSVFISKSVYRERQYDLSYRYAADFDFILYILRFKRVKFFDRDITYFREHQESITSSGRLDTERINILERWSINSYSPLRKSFGYCILWIEYKIRNYLKG